MVLDTTFCIDAMREYRSGRKGPALLMLDRLGDTPLAIPIFVLCELMAGAQMAVNPGLELRRVERFAELGDVLIPDRAFAALYGEAEAHLRRRGLGVATRDLLIGVAAKAVGQPLLTRNRRHFDRIPGLVVEVY